MAGVVERVGHDDEAAAEDLRHSTLGASPVWYSVSQENPCVITRRRLNCGCGAVGVHGLVGSKSVAIAYWSRSM